MIFQKNDLENPQVISRNRENSRANYIPYEGIEAVLKGD